MVTHASQSPASGDDVLQRLLASGRSIRLSGLDLAPTPHPLLAGELLCVRKGQAAVYPLRQVPQGNTWYMKKFHPGRRPTDEYLALAPRCLPGGRGFLACLQRRLLTAEHLDRWNSGFDDPMLAPWLEGTILMPQAPGIPWGILADELRAGKRRATAQWRLKAALSLAECTAKLEFAGCAHRDISPANVFCDDEGRTYFIDLDSLFHERLPYQPNTTVGTAGYIAPFLRDRSNGFDARRSWCACADRFALAALITEFILVDRAAPAHADGALLAQPHLSCPEHPHVKEQVRRLSQVSPRLSSLLNQALHASTFSDCPSPDHWQRTLRNALRTIGSSRSAPSGRTSSLARVKQTCSCCRMSFWITQDRLVELERRGKQALCPACLQAHLEQRTSARLQRDTDYPQVTCEHCHAQFRLPSGTLDQLRTRGKPILCRECLPRQLAKWQEERERWEREHPLVQCSQCGTSFRFARTKLKMLQAKGKSVLCRGCLSTRLSLVRRPTW